MALCKIAFTLMKKFKVTFYDAIYHAVAIQKAGILLTADESYCKKLKDTKNVVRLREWKI